jgi:hypothetical protein
MLYSFGEREALDARGLASVDDFVNKEIHPAHYALLAHRIRALALSPYMSKGMCRAPDAAVLTEKGKIMYANSYLGILLGVDPFRITGSAFINWIQEEDREGFLNWERQQPVGAESVLKLGLKPSPGVVISVEVEAHKVLFAGRQVCAFFTPVSCM